MKMKTIRPECQKWIIDMSGNCRRITASGVIVGCGHRARIAKRRRIAFVMGCIKKKGGMMDRIVIDIETAPVKIAEIPEENLAYLLEKNKSKRTQKIFEMDKDKITGFGPSAIGMPELSKIICCCALDGDGGEQHIPYNISERDILLDVAGRLKNAGQIVTFKGNSFDLPMLKIRGLLNGVAMPIPFNIKPWDDTYIDISYQLAGQYGIGSLSYWANVFGIKPPKWEIDDKSDLGKYPIGDVVKSCREDVRCTWELFQKLEL